MDTGPVVALLNRRDRQHAWVREVLDAVEPPIFTCEAVVSEACFLLGRVDPMSLADACLVRMTELDAQSVVLTLDSDFRVYRRNRRQMIPTIMPGKSA